MKTKNIFKTLILAAVLVSACGKNEIANDENTEKKGFALPVTVNVTREGDDATKATYNESTRKLSFSTGDKLFVVGYHDDAERFAGTLDYDAVSGKFSGTVTAENEYTGNIDDLMKNAYAFLLPAGYGSYGVFSIVGSGYGATASVDLTKAFALTKAAAVEQFSVEYASYSSGFALAPMNAIVSFTISGLTAKKKVDVSFYTGLGSISGNVTTSATGVATFAVGVSPDNDEELGSCTLTVDGNNIAMPTKTTVAGHIYNISRSATPATDLSTLTADYEAKDGETLTGTLANNVKISIADGATVTLKNVNITNLGDDCNWAGINCLGNATLVLEGTNEVCAGRDEYGDSNYPGIYIAPYMTLTIQGAGNLTAYSNGTNPYGAGIGGGFEIPCGNIVINSGNITATGGENGAGIGGCGYSASCGNITINGGTITATGGESAAGIGGGGYASCGNITISGGKITATGGEGAAGIGGGYTNGDYGTITIKSTVTSVIAMKGNNNAQSIGKGEDGKTISVTIEDGANVTQN